MSRRDNPQPEASGAHAFNWVLGGYLLVGAFFLLASHQAHWFGLAAYLLLLSCPLMLLLLHRDRGPRREAPKAQREQGGGTPPRLDDPDRPA